MGFDEILHDPSSRRAFLRAAGVSAAGGSVAFLAACGGGSKSLSATTSASLTTGLNADVAILNNAIDLEHISIAAYTAGIPLLTGTTQMAARQFLAQESSHVTALSRLVKQGGGKPIAERPTYNLGSPQRSSDVLAMLEMIERTAIGAYLDAIPRVSPGSVRTKLASILTNEAQHISLVRLALGTQPVPEALVTGRH
jgi:rubrerythrin